MNIFPDNMKNTSQTLTCESIASKLSIFYEQIHLYHLQTPSYAEHMALGDFYACIGKFKDDILEKLMGYKGMRIKAFSLGGDLEDYAPGSSSLLVNEVKDFSSQLEAYGRNHNMPDVEDSARILNGQAAKVLYLLTLK